MSKTKIVNIDELAQSTKAIVIDNQRHDMREMTVQEFIDKAAEAKKVDEKREDLSLDEQMGVAVNMIADAFPTITRERLSQLKLNQLTAIMDLIVTPPEQIEAELKASSGNG